MNSLLCPMTCREKLLAVLFSLSLTLWPLLATANIGGGSSRIPITDWIIELYNVTNNVYVPAICLFVIMAAAVNLAFGFVRVGPALGRVVIVIALVGLGVTFFANVVGAKLAIALVV